MQLRVTLGLAVLNLALAICSPALADPPESELPPDTSFPLEEPASTDARCITEPTNRQTRLIARGAPKWEIRADPGTSSQLTSAAVSLMRSGIYNKYVRLLGIDPSARHPARIYVLRRATAARIWRGSSSGSDSSLPDDVDGFTNPACDRSGMRPVIVLIDKPHAAAHAGHHVAHELFHLFQFEISNRYRSGTVGSDFGQSGRRVSRPVWRWMNNWWIEATAEWAAVTYGNDGYYNFLDEVLFPSTDSSLDRGRGYTAWRFVQHLEAYFTARDIGTMRLNHTPTAGFGKYLRRSIGTLAKREFDLRRPLSAEEATAQVAVALKASWDSHEFHAASRFPYLTDFNLGIDEPSPRLKNRARDPFSAAFLTFFPFHVVDRGSFGPAIKSNGVATSTLSYSAPSDQSDDETETITGTRTVTLNASHRLSFDALRFRVPDGTHKVTIRIDTTGTNSNTRLFYEHYGPATEYPNGDIPFASDEGNPGSPADIAFFTSPASPISDVPLGSNPNCDQLRSGDPTEQCEPYTKICNVYRVSDPDGPGLDAHHHEPLDIGVRTMPYRGSTSAIVLVNGSQEEEGNNSVPSATVTITADSDEHACDPRNPN